MAQEHVEELTQLRDQLVEDRRSLTASMLRSPGTMHESAGDFMGLQQFIDAVENALSHESSLERSSRRASRLAADLQR